MPGAITSPKCPHRIHFLVLRDRTNSGKCRRNYIAYLTRSRVRIPSGLTLFRIYRDTSWGPVAQRKSTWKNVSPNPGCRTSVLSQLDHPSCRGSRRALGSVQQRFRRECRTRLHLRTINIAPISRPAESTKPGECRRNYIGCRPRGRGFESRPVHHFPVLSGPPALSGGRLYPGYVLGAGSSAVEHETFRQTLVAGFRHHTTGSIPHGVDLRAVEPFSLVCTGAMFLSDPESFHDTIFQHTRNRRIHGRRRRPGPAQHPQPVRRDR